MGLAAITLSAALAIPAALFAQSNQDNHKHHHYKLFDIGTFGGPGIGIENPSSSSLNNRGMLVGVSDTSAPDPFAPDCFDDCYVDLGFLAQDGVVAPLEPLPGAAGLSTFAYAINDWGWIVGQSQNGSFDPSTGWPESPAVIWKQGHIANLGTLGGTQGIGAAINDLGQVIGASLTATPDPFANSQLNACMLCNLGSFYGTFSGSTIFFPATTETHAFLWQNGTMRDLHTLGGPDSNAFAINDRGEVAGWSFTSFVANPSTGVPTVDPFYWSPEDGMIDLGGLGGTYGSVAWINNNGQIAGASNLPGDSTEHPFLWSKSKGMKDLGTLGGTFGHPDWINDAGEVVGYATILGDQVGYAFLWRNGKMINLGTVGTDAQSESFSINSQGQVVGGTATIDYHDLRGFLWENGGPPVDLNTLIVPASSTYVTTAILINDNGDIAGLGKDANGNHYAVLLIPCDENHPGIEGCDYDLVDATAPPEVPEPRAVPSGTQPTPRSRRPNRYQVPGLTRAATRTASEATDPRPASTNGNGVIKGILAADSPQMVSLSGKGASAKSCSTVGERCFEPPRGPNEHSCCIGLTCAGAGYGPNRCYK
jgi:probable HAF family extracellular repeat protein